MSRKRRQKPSGPEAAPPGGRSEDTPEGASSTRLPVLLLAVVVMASAVAVGAAFVPAPHNGGDNAGYVSLAYSMLEHGAYQDLYDPASLPHTKYPPVFPALLAFLMLLGVRTWAGFKLVAAVSTVGASAFTYLWARRRVGATWAAGAALAVAFSSAVVYYSHWVLSDPTFLAFTMASLWALGEADEEGAHAGWLVGGVAAAGLAYFTRSAGLPLLVAVLVWLGMRRRWKALGFSAVALGIPALLWWLRARSVGDVQYVSEFWLVDPYNPGLGTVGVGGLMIRVVTNTGGYIGSHIPGGIVGAQGALVTVLGVVLTGLAVVGWWLGTRRRPGTTELFFPLYAGLILLWPVVWSGDRFALPLIPLMVVLGAAALQKGLGTGTRGRGVALLGLAVLLLPAAKAWTASAEEASACAAVVRQAGPFACYGPRMTQFVEAAAWSGDNLPAGSAVMSRKPRIFYALSGVPSRTFPFDTDPAVHFSEADGVEARYVLLDQVDGLAGRYVGGAVQQQPGAFCHVQSFEGQGSASQLLGLLPAGQRDSSALLIEEGGVRIAACPGDYVDGGQRGRSYSSSSTSSRIPLLDGLDP